MSFPSNSSCTSLDEIMAISLEAVKNFCNIKKSATCNMGFSEKLRRNIHSRYVANGMTSHHLFVNVDIIHFIINYFTSSYNLLHYRVKIHSKNNVRLTSYHKQNMHTCHRHNAPMNYIIQDLTYNKQYKYVSFYLLHNTAYMHFRKIYVDIDNTQCNKWHLPDLKIWLSLLFILFLLNIENLTQIYAMRMTFHRKENKIKTITWLVNGNSFG